MLQLRRHALELRGVAEGLATAAGAAAGFLPLGNFGTKRGALDSVQRWLDECKSLLANCEQDAGRRTTPRRVERDATDAEKR